jgi:carbon monoxide dehydrogenase subunit G
MSWKASPSEGRELPEGKATFRVEAPIEEVWDFLSSLERVGSCVPGVEEVNILDDRTADWTVKIKIGPLSQTMKVRTETTEQTPPTRGVFKGTGELMDVMGYLDLRKVSSGETEVTYRMEVNAKGPLGKVIENFMKGRLDRETREFAENVQKRLNG